MKTATIRSTGVLIAALFALACVLLSPARAWAANISILPDAPSVTPLGTVAFVANGGSGLGFVWSIPNNNSGGTIDGTGIYRAGTTGSVLDTVHVVDSLGASADVTISVGTVITLAPTLPAVAPRQSTSFVAKGGAGDYRFSFVTNASGGTVATVSGAYHAGPNPGVTDVVAVIDLNGATTTASIDVTAGVVISPENPKAFPFGSVSFTATGGSGQGYNWRLVGNVSGGNINSATGQYFAGPVSNVVDRVEVTDAFGNTAGINISVGAPLAITIPTANVAPRGAIGFSASGGSGTYVWSLVRSPSGGNVDSSTGVYRAGGTPSVVDRVRVTDGVGSTVEADVAVGRGVVVSPANSEVKARGTLTLTAAGGSGTGYAWAFEANASGAILSATGAYVAGTKQGADVIVATDSLGNSARAQVVVLVTPPAASAGFGADVELIPASEASDGNVDSIEGGGGCSSTSHAPPLRPALLAFGLAVAAFLGRRRASRRIRRRDAASR